MAHLRSIVAIFLVSIIPTITLARPQGPVSPSITPSPGSTSISDTYFGDFTDYSVDTSAIAALYASESAAYGSMTADFYRTAKPSDLARKSSEDAAWNSEYAALTSDLYNTNTNTYGYESVPVLNASESAQLAKGLADWTRTVGGSPTTTGAKQAAVPAKAAAAPTATANWPALTRADGPMAYGAHCIQYYASGREYAKSHCDTTIPQVCDMLSRSNAGDGDTDKWVYAQGDKSGCIMAFWLPKAVAGTGKVPTVAECKTQVYGEMVNLCIEAPGNPPGLYNAAVVNVDSLPGNGQPGTAVDDGAPRYFLAMTS